MFSTSRITGRAGGMLACVAFLVACGAAGGAPSGAGTGAGSWTVVPNSAFTGAVLHDVATFGNGFVAVGSGPDVGGNASGGVWTSADGTTWKAADPIPFAFAAVVSATAAGDGILALGGAPRGAPHVEFWGTSDAQTWAEPIEPPGSVEDDIQPTAIAAYGPHFVAVGNELVDVAALNGFDGRVFTSPDGEVWTAVPPVPDMHGASLAAISGGPSGFVIVGSITQSSGRVAASWSSSDGSQWTRAADDPSFTNAMMASVVGGGPGYIAVGSIGVDGAAWSSTDGHTWTPIATGKAFAGQPLSDVAVSPAGFVAVGGDPSSGGLAWTSRDGLVWTPTAAIPDSAGSKFISVAIGLKATVIIGNVGPGVPAAGLLWIGPLPG